jgi:hypothetical protein
VNCEANITHPVGFVTLAVNAVDLKNSQTKTASDLPRSGSVLLYSVAHVHRRRIDRVTPAHCMSPPSHPQFATPASRH